LSIARRAALGVKVSCQSGSARHTARDASHIGEDQKSEGAGSERERPKWIGADAEMLAPLERGPTFPPSRPLRYSLLASVVVIVATVLAAVVLYAVTEWLWLVVHQGLH
jgi:hypothetical protein